MPGMRCDFLFVTDIVKQLESAYWIFAKTMPENPHEYTLKKHWDSKQFENVVKAIRVYGKTVFYKNNWYICLDANGFRYWTMGSNMNEALLINRKKLDYFGNGYDDIAEDYDSIYSSKEFVEENKKLFAFIGNKIKNEILDVGCGTGIFLDYKKIPKKDYLGIDISSGMLNVFKRKHPGYKVIHTSFEDFYTSKKFDTILGLYGAPSYINPSYYWKFLELLKPEGELILMFYDKFYFPHVNNYLPKNAVKLYKNNFSGIKLFNKYVIVSKNDLMKWF